MRAAYDALDDETKAECENLICEHSQLFSRSILGFADFTDEERRKFAPVQQRLVRRHPVTGRKSLFLASHAGAILGWPVPEARAFLRDLTEACDAAPVRLCACMAAMGSGGVGQPGHDAPGEAVR